LVCHTSCGPKQQNACSRANQPSDSTSTHLNRPSRTSGCAATVTSHSFRALPDPKHSLLSLQPPLLLLLLLLLLLPWQLLWGLLLLLLLLLLLQVLLKLLEAARRLPLLLHDWELLLLWLVWQLLLLLLPDGCLLLPCRRLLLMCTCRELILLPLLLLLLLLLPVNMRCCAGQLPRHVPACVGPIAGLLTSTCSRCVVEWQQLLALLPRQCRALLLLFLLHSMALLLLLLPLLPLLLLLLLLLLGVNLRCCAGRLPRHVPTCAGPRARLLVSTYCCCVW